MAGSTSDMLIHTMLALINEIRQEYKNNIGSVHSRVDEAECRLDQLDLRIQQITEDLNSGQYNTSRQNRQRGHFTQDLLELQTTANGRYICIFCQKDYSPAYIKRHVSNVCWPKANLNGQQ